jgi:pimeloyl-ACP methyl ester carboxylesterase
MAIWGDFAARLATGGRVIAFDPRGVGLSSDVPLRYSTRDMASDAVALLDGLGVDRAHVFGLSLGGMVAQWIAIDAPRRVDRLILASTLPRALAASPRALLRGAALLRCFARSGAEADVCLAMHILSSRFRAANPEGSPGLFLARGIHERASPLSEHDERSCCG